MTFQDIINRVLVDLNLSGPATIARIGQHVNERYRYVLGELGMNAYTRVLVDVDLEANTQYQVYDSDDPIIGRIVALYWTPTPTDDTPSPRSRMLDELSFEEMQEVVPTTSDTPKCWAKVRVGTNTTTFKIDSTIPNGAVVSIEGEEFPSMLEDEAEPLWESMYHDILVFGAKSDEYSKMTNKISAKEYEDKFQTALGKMRLRQALMAGGLVRQGKHRQETRLPWMRGRC